VLSFFCRVRDAPRLAQAAVLLSSAAIALLTLVPVPGEGSSHGFLCLTCGSWLQDGLDNVLLFLPLGLALGASGVKPVPATLASLVFSVVIEFLQWVSIPGRDSALADILANGLGGALGAFAWAGGVWAPSPRLAAQLALTGAIGAGVWASGPLRWFDPVASEGPYWPHLRPVAHPPERNPGRLLEAAWNGRPLEWGPDPGWPAMRRDLEDRRIQLRVRSQLVEAPPQEWLLLRVSDGRGRQIAAIGVRGCAAWGTVAQRGEASGTQEIAVAAELTRCPAVGDVLAIRLEIEPSGWRIVAGVNGEESESRLSPAPSLGMAFLSPGFKRLTRNGGSAAMTWLLTPAVLTAWWSARSRRRGVAWYAAALLALTILVIAHPLAAPGRARGELAAVLVAYAVAAAGFAVVLRGEASGAATAPGPGR
jgi:hypothetical protein